MREVIPDLVVASDWSVNPRKRWCARAEWQSDYYLVFPPEPIGDVTTFLERITRESKCALIGFDFPIGLPAWYAQLAGISSFVEFLTRAGSGKWSRFYEISNRPTLQQPFYPPHSTTRGEYSRASLVDGLGASCFDELLRQCERATIHRDKAESIFFTLGGKQVGRAAISGWQQVLAPRISAIGVWPFAGELAELLKSHHLTVAEIYPAEAYKHLGITLGPGTGRSKTRQADRKKAGAQMAESIEGASIEISGAAQSWFDDGFKSDDDFDATVGLLSMLQVVLGARPAAVPNDNSVRAIEGWILGQSLDSKNST